MLSTRARDRPAVLAEIAAIVAVGSGCRGLGTSSCDGYVANQRDIDVTGAVACRVASQSGGGPETTNASWPFGQACNEACGPGYGVCFLPAVYLDAYRAANPATDGGAASLPSADAGIDGEANDGGLAAGPICPSFASTVRLKCSDFCEGRRTAGIDAPHGSTRFVGDYLAACAYLEAVSARAFARLALELESHCAPEHLVTLARNAEREEVGHTRAIGAIAKRFGVDPERPTDVALPLRALTDIALENAVEGCIRETYE